MGLDSAEGKTPRRFGRADRKWIGTAAIFLLLTVLWLWCRNGGISQIRIVAIGDEFKAYVNGKLIAEGRDAGISREGGIGIWYDQEPYWGFPIPQALQSVRVTDNASGALLLDQDFRQPLSSVWTERPASCKPCREGLRCDRLSPVRLNTGLRPWRDYTLDLNVQNCTVIEVRVRYRDPENHILFMVRPFRDIDSGLTSVTHGARQTFKSGRPYYTLRAMTKNILLIFMYYFPWWALVLAPLAAMGCRFGHAEDHRKAPLAAIEIVFVALLFAGACVYLSWITCTLLDGIPHVQDSVVYNFQAQTLSRGALYAPAPPNPPSFAFDFLMVQDGKWFGHFPLGHPLLLMFGHLVGRPWIVPPLVGACVLVLIYLIARELFSREAGAVSALLAFSSPFFQVHAPNFMSHSSGSFYLALGIFSLIKASRGGGRWWGILSGVALGLFFNTRPLNAVPAIALSFALLFYFVLTRRASWGVILGFCAGGLLMFAFFLYTNYALVGNPFQIHYRPMGDAIDFFGEKQPLGLSLLHYYASMTMFIMIILGWPPVFTTGFFLAFLLLAKKNAWELFLFLLFVCMTVVNVLNPTMSSPIYMYGPRYMYEAFFVFIMMAAAGWDRARMLVERGIDVRAASSRLCARALSWLAHAAFLALPAILVFGAQQRWLSPSKGLFNYRFMPGNVFGLKGFNHTSGAMIEKIRSHGIHHALIFVDDRESSWCWWFYGAVFTLNSPFLDSDIIVVRNLKPEENQKVINAFPGRKLYRVNVERNEIRDYE